MLILAKIVPFYVRDIAWSAKPAKLVPIISLAAVIHLVSIHSE